MSVISAQAGSFSTVPRAPLYLSTIFQKYIHKAVVEKKGRFNPPLLLAEDLSAHLIESLFSQMPYTDSGSGQDDIQKLLDAGYFEEKGDQVYLSPASTLKLLLGPGAVFPTQRTDKVAVVDREFYLIRHRSASQLLVCR
jgi:hypothetical protein